MKKILTLLIAGAMALTAQKAVAAVGCDTLSNLNPTDTLTLYLSNTGGYLSGNNAYGDQQKAEYFSGPIGSTLSGAFIGFGYTTINAGDSATPITIYAYDATGYGNSPGNAIDSATLTLRQIAASIAANAPAYVGFTSGYTLSAHGFFVSVQLPTTTGDTLAVLTNYQYSQDGQGWELYSGTDGWYSYSQSYQEFPYTFGNDIAAVTCGGAPLAAFQSSLLNSCTGAPFTVQFYNTSSNGATNFAWFFPGGSPASSTAANPSVTYSAIGSYNVYLGVTGTGGSDTDFAAVNVYPALTSTVTTTPASSASATDGTATITVSGGTNTYYISWDDQNNDMTASISGLTPGVYYVNVLDSSGCSFNDSAVISYANGLVNLSNGKTMRVYPNPASDVLNLNWSAPTTATLSITNISGQVVAQYNVSNATAKTLDVATLPAGAYILSIREANAKSPQAMKFSKF